MIVVDEKLELLNRRILENRIPEVWLDHSYPSLLERNQRIFDCRNEFVEKQDFVMDDGIDCIRQIF
jgi:hypothetical protein